MKELTTAETIDDAIINRLLQYEAVSATAVLMATGWTEVRMEVWDDESHGLMQSYTGLSDGEERALQELAVLARAGIRVYKGLILYANEYRVEVGRQQPVGVQHDDPTLAEALRQQPDAEAVAKQYGVGPEEVRAAAERVAKAASLGVTIPQVQVQ